jgi:hypothetical protein
VSQALVLVFLIWLAWFVFPTKKRAAERRKATATHRHYKGGYYRVINLHVRHTETRELMVVYQHVYPHGPGEWQARPADLFFGTLEDGRPRFEELQPSLIQFEA